MKKQITSFLDKNELVSDSFWSILAFLRFILCLIVFVGHLHAFTYIMPTTFNYIMLLGGKAAVLCFLLISGVSIGYSYLKSGDGYLKRRFLRIYPLYFFAVVATVLLQYLIGSPFSIAGRTMVAAGLLQVLLISFFYRAFFL